jgi:hypothetical protein
MAAEAKERGPVGLPRHCINGGTVVEGIGISWILLVPERTEWKAMVRSMTENTYLRFCNRFHIARTVSGKVVHCIYNGLSGSTGSDHEHGKQAYCDGTSHFNYFFTS